VIGVVRDARHTRLQAAPPPTVYFSIDQPHTPARSLEVRVTGDPAAATAAIRAALQRAEPNLLIDRAVPIAMQLDRSMGQERLVAYLTSGFGLLALVVASIGLYGVLSYGVARRTQEFGIRAAIGATPGDVTRLSRAPGAPARALGVAAGLAAALLASRLIASLLFGVSAVDPATYAAVVAVLAVVALAACYLPARRASRVDPILALRAD
jgi:ABC-type lipoprotein release transport system permease subunit